MNDNKEKPENALEFHLALNIMSWHSAFIKIDTPFPKGSMVTIQFDVNKEEGKTTGSLPRG